MGVSYFKVRRHKAEGLRTVGILLTSAKTWKGGVKERIRGNRISLTLVTSGCNVGRCVDVSPARLVESPVSELVSVSKQGPREGTTGGGLVRGATQSLCRPSSNLNALSTILYTDSYKFQRG